MSVARLALIWLVLMLLLAASVGASFLPIGHLREAISLAIAAIKAALILWVFMNLRRSEGLARLALLGTLTFLAAIMILSSADYLTRGWLGDEVLSHHTPDQPLIAERLPPRQR
ncbi:MAG: oxidase [Rhizobiaceae bacterium]|nr:MAG: oxidase [Rhizobiaceae bacterium]